MGIYDRDYARPDHGGPQMRFAMPSITPAVKYLLIINVVVFLLNFFLDQQGKVITPLFAVYAKDWWQVWRLVTYQFLHAGFGHIFFNMLLLFFFGPFFERTWGTKKFLQFYLICGAAGGIVFPILVSVNWVNNVGLVGASGALYGLLAAAAILMPKMRVYVFGVFPLPMAVLVVILILSSLLGLLGGANAGGEAAHLAGAATAAIYILWKPLLNKKRAQVSHSRWQQKVDNERNFHVEVDRILAKVHDSGINSLTKNEKQILKQATQNEQNDL